MSVRKADFKYKGNFVTYILHLYVVYLFFSACLNLYKALPKNTCKNIFILNFPS